MDGAEIEERVRRINEKVEIHHIVVSLFFGRASTPTATRLKTQLFRWKRDDNRVGKDKRNGRRRKENIDKKWGGMK